MSFVAVRDALSVDDRTTVDARLALLARESNATRQAVMNLEAEANLPRPAWESLVSSLLKAPHDVDAIMEVIRRFARAWVLRGPDMKPPRPARLGRAVTFETFCQKLVSRNRYASLSIARSSVRRMIGKSPAVVSKRLGNGFRLELYAMWGTFDPLRLGDPFDGLGSAAEIRGVLGLPPNELGPLIVFEYVLPDHLPALLPTVADACASDEWSCGFRPPRSGDPHGWTMPSPAFPAARPRPEVVHDSVCGEHLASPMREVS